MWTLWRGFLDLSFLTPPPPHPGKSQGRSQWPEACCGTRQTRRCPGNCSHGGHSGVRLDQFPELSWVWSSPLQTVRPRSHGAVGLAGPASPRATASHAAGSLKVPSGLGVCGAAFRECNCLSPFCKQCFRSEPQEQALSTCLEAFEKGFGTVCFVLTVDF